MSHLEIPSYPNALLRQGYVVPMDNYTTLLYSALLYSTLLCYALLQLRLLKKLRLSVSFVSLKDGTVGFLPVSPPFRFAQSFLYC